MIAKNCGIKPLAWIRASKLKEKNKVIETKQLVAKWLILVKTVILIYISIKYGGVKTIKIKIYAQTKQYHDQ